MSRRARLALGSLLGLQAALYLVVIAGWSPPGAVELSDVGLRVVEAISYHRHGLGRLDIHGPNQAIDPQHRWRDSFTADVGGRLYGENSPFFAALSSQPYGWLGARGLLLLPALAALVCTVLTFVLARRQMPDGWAVGAAAVVGLASPVMVYGQIVWEHSLAVALCLGSLALLPRHAVLGGLLGGGAAWLRTEELFFGIAVGAILLWEPEERRRAVVWLAGWVLAVAGLLIVNAWLYGMPLGVHLAAVSGDRGGLNRLVWWHELWQRMVLPDGAPIYLTLLVALGSRFAARRRAERWLDALNALAVLAMTAAVVWAGTGSTAARALPWLLLMLRPGLAPWVVAPRLSRMALLFCGLVLAVSPAHAGDCWGPRFLLPAVPLFAIGIVAAMAAETADTRRTTWLVAALLVLLSAASQVRTVAILVQRRMVTARLETSLRDAAAGCAAIVSDAAVVPLLCPTLYHELPMLVLNSPTDLRAVQLRVGGRPVLLVLEDAGPWKTAVPGLAPAGGLDEPALTLWRATPEVRRR